nr:hypothetical protein CFP56_07395 [Quercus suber]
MHVRCEATVRSSGHERKRVMLPYTASDAAVMQVLVQNRCLNIFHAQRKIGHVGSHASQQLTLYEAKSYSYRSSSSLNLMANPA